MTTDPVRDAVYIEFLRVNSLQKVNAVSGEMIYFDNENAASLAPGAAGQLLTTNGAGLPPTWGPGGLPTIFTVNTTDATSTLLASFPTVLDSTLRISAAVVGHRTGGTAGVANDSFSLQLEGLSKNNAGVITAHSTSTVQIKDQLTWQITLVPNAPNIELRVQGALNNNITWTAQVFTF
jgi:hypothetical protein